RPENPFQQRRTGRVVFVLTPADKQRLEHYIDKESMSEALRETVSIIYKIGLESRGVKVLPKLDELESFIQDVSSVLRNKDIDTTIKSKKSVIKIRDGHIFFLSPSAAREEEANQAYDAPAVVESIQTN
ncbi:unnamed protein product, partial [marine sediment metagenome]